MKSGDALVARLPSFLAKPSRGDPRLLSTVPSTRDASADLRLGYCTNVHDAESPDAIERMVRAETAPVLRAADETGCGLRLDAATAAAYARDPDALKRLRATLAAHRVDAFTVNAFPYGAFHAPRVKEAAYAPDWTTEARVSYSIDAAVVAANLRPDDDPFSSASTVPLGFKLDVDAIARAARNLVDVVPELEAVEEKTGVRVPLALEPEPGCALETLAATAEFFKDVLLPLSRTRLDAKDGRAGDARLLDRVGVCFDVCHAAVMGEDVDVGLDRLAALGVSVPKTQLSNALRVPRATPKALEALSAFDEPRFLHQTSVLRLGRLVAFALDLDGLRALVDRGAIESSDELRCHFHVPLDVDAFPPLATTRDLLKRAVAAALRVGCRRFEVETYAFGVLPKERRDRPLKAAIADELRFARSLLPR
jgi:sugar phosphate isomerase/epimerase